MRKFASRRRVPLLAAASVAVALVLGGLVVLTRPAPGAGAGATTSGVRALPRLDDADEMLSVSPDGTKAAFMDYDKGQNLAVLDVTSQRITPLTNFDWAPGSSWVYDAAWSSDGQRIAYRQCPLRESERACELRAVTLSGESSVITRNQAARMQPGGWLPDGSAIVVTIQQNDRTATIGLVPTNGGEFVPLRSITNWTGRAAPLPRVSPDGRLIAFVEGSPGDIHVMSSDGRTTHRVTDHPAEDYLPVWSPDGRHLAFLSDRGGMPALWTVPIKEGQPDSEPVRVRDGMEDVGPVLGWTTRGLAYSQYQQADDIYTMPVDPESGEPRDRPRLIPYRRTGHNRAPEWSPDGKYLAFVSSSSSALDQPDRRVVLLPGDGGEAREFPAPAHRFWAMRWFGDSRGLGITGHDGRSERMMFRLTIATGEWQTFPLPATGFGLQWNGMYFDWNADGSRYFYGWQDSWFSSQLTIVERDLQSNRDRIVYSRKPENNLDRYRGLRFSPDRRSLTFRSIGGVFVLDVESGEARVLHDEVNGETLSYGQRSEVPTWSPSGRALLVQRDDSQETGKQDTELRLIPADGSGVRRIPLPSELTRPPSSRPGASKPTIRSVVWSPDGSRLAFAVRASRVDSFVIEDPLVLPDAADAVASR
jgi:Tol biopolymer transport system component